MSNNDQNQMYEVLIQTITAASQMPFVKVNREEFLRKEFSGDKYIEKIIKDGPQSVFTSQALRKRAQKVITNSTNKTSIASFVTGIPSNPVTAFASGGADVIQYFGFALNLSQQIAYLFGEDDLFNGDYDKLPEEARIRIIAYLGIMFGASGSSALIANISKTAGKNIGKKVTQKALTKTSWYPLVKKIGSTLGVKITKQSVGKSITKIVPLIGGVVSGGLTYVTFKPMGNKLADTFVDLLDGNISDDFEGINEYKADFRQKMAENAEVIDADFTETTY
ncbi:hypothetical protein SAMN02910293_00539 [Streptococcus henryi]|uniref:EcsC protein family protein n=1 Tax=Streptococcus henryi TaxID=439219 RepID=A0A1G6AQ94_9STRE|nr:hypothetical protein [Streptococcus henryi]SDB10525.1 hypothetical protein SAMN02910293_00539 [Streptococcus henryi]